MVMLYGLREHIIQELNWLHDFEKKYLGLIFCEVFLCSEAVIPLIFILKTIENVNLAWNISRIVLLIIVLERIGSEYSQNLGRAASMRP